MPESKITEPLMTIVSVNYNTSDFVDVMLYGLNKLTFNNYKVLICDNGSKKKDIAKLKSLENEYPNLDLIFRRQDARGSIAHGRALDILIDCVDTKYTVVLDSDCVFLLRNWDIEMTRYINDKTKIVGATSPVSRKGDRQGGGDFPLPFAALFETAVYKSLKIRCVPDTVCCGADTAWQWKCRFTEAGFRGKTLISRNTRDYKQGPFAFLTGIEEYYTDDNRLMASHFGRGSSDGAAKYLKWMKLPGIGTVVKRMFGNIEKQKWIAICRGIIDSQIQ